MFDEEKVCGTCKYNKRTESEDEFICDNHDGEYFSDYVGYSDKCPDWEEKDEM